MLYVKNNTCFVLGTIAPFAPSCLFWTPSIRSWNYDSYQSYQVSHTILFYLVLKGRSLSESVLLSAVLAHATLELCRRPTVNEYDWRKRERGGRMKDIRDCYKLLSRFNFGELENVKKYINCNLIMVWLFSANVKLILLWLMITMINDYYN